jgi:hypothetical protein
LALEFFDQAKMTAMSKATIGNRVNVVVFERTMSETEPGRLFLFALCVDKNRIENLLSIAQYSKSAQDKHG